MRSFAFAGLFALLSFSSVIAQNSELRGYSMYSYLGLGLPNDYKSSFAASMGVTGVALSNRVGTSFANPALYSRSYFTTAGGGLSYRNLNARDNFGSSSNSQADALALQLVFPIVREKIGFSFGMLPITENSYSTSSRAETVNGSDTIRYISGLMGAGGLNRLEAGIGIAVTDWLSVGYAPSLVLGTIRNIKSVGFITTGYHDYDNERVLSNIGFGNRFGIFTTFPKLFLKNDVLNIGAVVSLPVRLNSDLLIKESQLINNMVQQERTKLGRGENELPAEFTLGLTYSPNPYVMSSTEVLVQNWGSYKDFDGNTPNYLKNRMRVGTGVQYIPSSRNDGFFGKFLYRGGMSFDSGHLELSNTSITTLLFSAGIGIPSRAPGSSVDLSFDYGVRGTTSHDLVREQIFTFRMSFNLSELMFLQRKID